MASLDGTRAAKMTQSPACRRRLFSMWRGPRWLFQINLGIAKGSSRSDCAVSKRSEAPFLTKRGACLAAAARRRLEHHRIAHCWPSPALHRGNEAARSCRHNRHHGSLAIRRALVFDPINSIASAGGHKSETARETARANAAFSAGNHSRDEQPGTRTKRRFDNALDV